MTLEEQRDMIQASIDGKEIEAKFKKHLNDSWDIQIINESTPFDFDSLDYRIKPESEPTCWGYPLIRLMGASVIQIGDKGIQWMITGIDSGGEIHFGGSDQNIDSIADLFDIIHETVRPEK